MLGVDCGSTSTGVGVLESDGRDARLLHYGAIRPTRSRGFGERLQLIHRELEKLVERFRPHTIAVEQVFQAYNVKSAMQLSQVRGVVLLAAARAGLPVSEYSALAIKQSIVGYGRAEKHQVQRMVQRLLGLPEPPEPEDAADALAVAFCHLHVETTRRRLASKN
ncbi:crossover junction endodeoxyribonuclease RuvC [Acidobacteriia bacterium AH_259_A11_L15]|nr:crossover junction endodeoxyribonuclease RuvC [Acidobacteriia bacterium AH_259_A11_L15]